VRTSDLTRLYETAYYGSRRRNEVTTMNEDAGQTNTRKEGKLAVTSTEDGIRKNFQANFILSTDRKT
jgi:hypothetical protein